jgi:Mn2+/Fe2+ NRAMP family transporter
MITEEPVARMMK